LARKPTCLWLHIIYANIWHMFIYQSLALALASATWMQCVCVCVVMFDANY